MKTSRKIPFKPLFSLGVTGAVVTGLISTVQCSSYSTYRGISADCTIESEYDFDVRYAFETVGSPGFWSSPDKPKLPEAYTLVNDAGEIVRDDAGLPITVQPPASSPARPDKWDSGYWLASATVNPIPDGPRCSSSMAMLLSVSGNNDWGALFGTDSPLGDANLSAYEGVSFWARSPAASSKALTLVLSDVNSAAPEGGATYRCIQTDAGVNAQGASSATIDPNTGTIISGSSASAVPADSCGNDFQTIVGISTEWRLYTIPFGDFKQSALANRVPNDKLKGGGVPGTGLLPDHLVRLTLRVSRESPAEIWIDNLGFYRKKGVIPAWAVDSGVK